MIAGLASIAVAVTLAQSGPAAAPLPPPHAPVATGPVAAAFDWSPRLAGLSPREPVGYFELAEEVAAEDRTMSGRLLARRLYVLAAHLPKAAAASPAPEPRGAAEPAPDWLAASACLGLAAIADTEQDRRWLIAMAGTLSPESDGSPRGRPTDAGSHDAAALQLATALGHVRSGDGRKAMKILNTPAVAALLSRYEGLLNPGGMAGGADRVRSLAERHVPCPQCRNRRTVKDADGVKLCPTCRGRPGPNLTVPELLGQLRLESLLLNGIQRSWAAQTVADGGAPMRELDIGVLLDVYDVDVRRTVWKDGQWVEPPGTADPAASAPGEGAPPEQQTDR